MWTTALSSLSVCFHSSRRLRRRRVGLESLESRQLLATITVDTLLDETNNPSTTSVREAISQAVNLPGDDTIVFDSSLAGGTVTLTQGQLVIDDPNSLVTIDGNEQITLDAGGNNRVLLVDFDTTVTIDGLTITGGSVGNSGGGGAGIRNRHSLSLLNSTVSGNSARSGAGIINYDYLSVVNSTISGNSASQRGGGIYHFDSVSSDSLVVINSTISGNTAQLGGGIKTRRNGSTSIVDSTLSDNFASGSGGAINNGSFLSVVNSTIRGNTTTNRGGGIFNDDTLVMSDSTVSGNSATSRGGGIYGFRNGSLSVTNSTITENHSNSYGGGILASDRTFVTNSTISGNRGTRGGGISFLANSLSAINSTITGNTATDDGGGFFIRFDGTVSLINSIVATNTAIDDGPDIDGQVVNSSFNFIGNRQDSSGLTDGVNGNQVGTSASPIDPLLGPLQDNGGVTFTQALLPGSPAIDAASDAGLTADQRGVLRPLGDGFDIGAFEAEPPIVVTTTADVINSGDNQTSLREAVTFAASKAGEDTVTFASSLVGSTLTLSSQLILDDASGSVTLAGDGQITLDGGGNSRVVLVEAGTDATLDGLTLTGGQLNGSGNRGAGILNMGTLLLIDSSVRGNRSGIDGGGIVNTSQLTVVNSTVIDNQAGGDGGGIDNRRGNLTLINSTLSGNRASRAGGGIFNRTNSALSLSNSTVSDNTASQRGGGIFNNASLSLFNTIVAANEANNGGTDLFGSVAGSSSSNLIGIGDGSSGLTDGVNGNQVGTSTSPIDPLLGPLQDNGGATFTQALLPGSPAIDAGDNAAVGSLTTDQRGRTRITDGSGDATATVDIGAFEVQPVPSAALDGDGNLVVVGTDGDDSLILQGDAISGIQVTFNAVDLGTFAVTGTIEVALLIGDDTLDGSALTDKIGIAASLHSGHDSMIGGDGNDTVDAGSGDDTVDGEGGLDFIEGGTGNDSLTGANGEDTLSSGLGEDTLRGGGGEDSLDGGDGNDLINGDQSADAIDGGSGDDTLIGRGGNDTIIGGLGNDSLSGLLDDDWLQGGPGQDTLDGGNGADTLQGESDDDLLLGGQGADSLEGGDGEDTLGGGRGTNTLIGGDDADVFRFQGGVTADQQTLDEDALGQLRHRRRLTDNTLVATDSVIDYESIDLALLLALNGNDSVSVDSALTAITGTLAGGLGNDSLDLPAAFQGNWTVQGFE